MRYVCNKKDFCERGGCRGHRSEPTPYHDGEPFDCQLRAGKPIVQFIPDMEGKEQLYKPRVRRSIFEILEELDEALDSREG